MRRSGDADRVGGRAKDRTAASTSEMARFETDTLGTRENLTHLSDVSGRWIDRAHRHRNLTKLILDMDSSVSETYGQQQGSAYNGHFEWTCYHLLFLFHPFGAVERVMLRRGNHASAKFWRRVLMPVIERYRGRDVPKFFCGDSAFALPKLFALLEREGFRYAIRLMFNALLERKIARWAARRTRRRCSTTTCGIGPGRGTNPAGWWSRSPGTPASCSRGWASSSPT